MTTSPVPLLPAIAVGEAHAVAQAYVAASLSVVPVRTDGSKQPAIAWKPFQSRAPSPFELAEWFRRPCPYGMAALTASPQNRHLEWERPVTTGVGQSVVRRLLILGHCNLFAGLVTFNEADFRGAERFGVRVVRPQEFLAELKEREP